GRLPAHLQRPGCAPRHPFVVFDSILQWQPLQIYQLGLAEERLPPLALPLFARVTRALTLVDMHGPASTWPSIDPISTWIRIQNPAPMQTIVPPQNRLVFLLREEGGHRPFGTI